MRILLEGDTGVALAPQRGKVPIVYRYQDITLDSGVVVPDVLVGVSDETGEVLSIPSQSTPKIKSARSQAKEETITVRIPNELNDVLWLVSDELGADPSKFSSAVVRFYLSEAVTNSSLARRLKRLSMSQIAQRTRKSKLTFRMTKYFVTKVHTVEKAQRVTRSDLVRGAVLAAKEDVFEGKAKQRTERLRAIANVM
jgi:hypothetical protein